MLPSVLARAILKAQLDFISENKANPTKIQMNMATYKVIKESYNRILDTDYEPKEILDMEIIRKAGDMKCLA